MPVDHNNAKKKSLDYSTAKNKAESFCTYQERSQNEVRKKLTSYGLDDEMIEELISELIINNFINEERFAKAYVSGKFRLKKWGKLKIIKNIQGHNISPICLKKGLEEIEEKDYYNTLKLLIERKKESLNNLDDHTKLSRLVRYAVQKGYESELVWSMLKF